MASKQGSQQSQQNSLKVKDEISTCNFTAAIKTPGSPQLF
jgi:hypothetical protein